MMERLFITVLSLSLSDSLLMLPLLPCLASCGALLLWSLKQKDCTSKLRPTP